MTSKIRSKEEKGKNISSLGQNNEDFEDVDYSLLRKPINTSITGFAQARKIFDLATEELKELLSRECDLLYECRVCRNLFRSLANFISHKRVYCKEKFNCKVHSHFIKTNDEMQKIKRLEESYHNFFQENVDIDSNKDDEIEDRIPLTKDLTSIVEKMVISKGVAEEQIDNQDIVLQKIPKSAVAVYQTIQSENNKSNMLCEVTELDNILSRENAVMQNDGKFKVQGTNEESENVIQISDDDDNDSIEDLKCKLCDQHFSSQKTLKSHIKIKHLESRLVYPCPDCLEIFSTCWSVYRHLFKVHRKTAAQIRRLRETIQSKGFRMNNPPAFYEKRKASTKVATSTKITDEERIDQENQAWLENIEGDGEIPRCGGCGRTFERRAALTAHTNTCQSRSRALTRRPPETKKIEIQIRKDYNKGPSSSNTPSKSQDKSAEEVSLETPTKSQQQKDDIESRNDVTLTEAVMSIVGITGGDENNEIQESNAQPKYDIESLKPMHKLPFSHQEEKSNFNALKQRMLQEIELEQLLCKKCDKCFQELIELFDHVAGHYNWMRYACKLCPFKHYEYEKVVEHIRVVHKLKGDSDFSALKAIDGVKAAEYSDLKDDVNETSPDSRRPSRCSSESSRFSDDSSSSSTRIEVGSRKRKMNPGRNVSKKKRVVLNDEGDGDSKDSGSSPLKMSTENDLSSKSRVFDENSSDMDDSEVRSTKLKYTLSTSRRPVRKRTKPKNEDYEYDLSNLLKLEAQGYRDSFSSSAKPAVTKRKNQQDLHYNYAIINKECCGALALMARQSVEENKALVKTTNVEKILNTTKEKRISNIFVRPMLPKITRIEKVLSVDSGPTLSKENQSASLLKQNKIINKQPLDFKDVPEDTATEVTQTNDLIIKTKSQSEGKKSDERNENHNETGEINKIPTKPAIDDKTSSQNKGKSQNLNVVPIKLHKPGILQNPLIKKNMTEFSKAGMKTKILVIKYKGKDGVTNVKAPKNIPTIKIKDPKLNKCNERIKSDQVFVIPVPKGEGTAIPRPSIANNNNKTEIPSSATQFKSAISNEELNNHCNVASKNNATEKNENQDKPEVHIENTNAETPVNNKPLSTPDAELAITN
ncbi:unnamed protein product [Leptosia nina]|uniref:C2H2-type domain-containing protein n=1 Tax=Leptosia nina TaxID=320188 RepID=A0AAV1J9H0_9NEOP